MHKLEKLIVSLAHLDLRDLCLASHYLFISCSQTLDLKENSLISPSNVIINAGAGAIIAHLKEAANKVLLLFFFFFSVFLNYPHSFSSFRLLPLAWKKVKTSTTITTLCPFCLFAVFVFCFVCLLFPLLFLFLGMEKRKMQRQCCCLFVCFFSAHPLFQS